MGAGLRVIFMGTPDFAAKALQALIDSRHDVIAVYSQPPRPRGRGQQVQKSPVHMLAEQHGIAVFTPKNFKEEKDRAEFAALDADVAVVAAYGLILPQVILDAPGYGCLNIHASLLPRWRGAAPIHRAIEAGDEKTGITIMQMEAGLDTGPMIAVKEVGIESCATTGSLHDILASAGSRMIVDVLDRLKNNGHVETVAQPEEGVVYAEKISKEEAHIDWSKDARAIDRLVRAFNPFPGAWCLLPDGSRLKILCAALSDGSGSEGSILNDLGDVACGEKSLRLVTVQPEGKKPMDAAAAFNGGYLSEGMRLS